jgi:hypothetical protein
MQSQLTDETRFMRDDQYAALKAHVAASSIEVEEVDNEHGGKTLRVPHPTFTTWGRHLDKQVEKRRRHRKQGNASRARNRR